MIIKIDSKQADALLESLNYSKRKIQEYNYQNQNIRTEKEESITRLIDIIRNAKKESK